MSEHTDKHVGFKVDANVVELVDKQLGYGERSELLRRFMRQVAYGDGDDVTATDVEIERLKELRDEAKEDRRQADATIESCEDKIERLQEQRKHETSRQDKLDAAFSTVEQRLRTNGEYIHDTHWAIENIAEALKIPRSDVHVALKERNSDVPPHAFRKKHETEEPWMGMPKHLVDLPPAERADVPFTEGKM